MDVASLPELNQMKTRLSEFLSGNPELASKIQAVQELVDTAISGVETTTRQAVKKTNIELVPPF